MNKANIIESFDIKSSCGVQIESTKITSPSAIFCGDRTNINNNLISIPGPGAYQIPSYICKSPISTVNNPPSCSISGREKFGSTTDLKASGNMPGPGDYNCKIVNINEKKSPTYTLGKKWNDSNQRLQKLSPGPGAYNTPSSLGQNVLSTQKTQPTVKFSNVSRETTNKKRNNTNNDEIGPTDYKVNSGNTVGEQIESIYPNSAAFSFSVVGRTKAPIGSRMMHDKVPGPGTYKVKSAVGPQVLSNLKNSPKCSMSGRTKFGSHF